MAEQIRPGSKHHLRLLCSPCPRYTRRARPGRGRSSDPCQRFTFIASEGREGANAINARITQVIMFLVTLYPC